MISLQNLKILVILQKSAGFSKEKSILVTKI
jgi:hypothetical protein